MSAPSWQTDELEEEAPVATPTSPALVTLHFLLTALKRRWRVWVGLGCVGMLLGLAWTLASPPASVGTVTLLLAHDPAVDRQQAMATDVSLLRTRTLAAEVVEELDLDMTPEAFQQSVVSLPESTEVLVLEVTGPGERAAVERARAFGDAYLAFRTSQMRSQLDALTSGYQDRIASLRARSQALRRQYNELRRDGLGNGNQASALVARQAEIRTEIASAQRSIRDASLKAESVIEASYVLDPAAGKPRPSPLKPLILAMASGLIGASALGIGLVLTSALLSNRLRLREEVALALDAPVRVGVGPLRPRRSWPTFRHKQNPTDALRLLVDAVEQQVTHGSRAGKSGPARLALACVDNREAGRLVMEELVARLSTADLAVFVLDLTTTGGLAATLTDTKVESESGTSRRRLVVHRPDRLPSLVQGPTATMPGPRTELPENEPWGDAWKRADVVLALVEVDPAVGLEHLASWVDETVVLVTAGRSSAERLRTTRELIRAAGLGLPYALMINADRTDETLGLPTADAERRLQGRISG